MSGATMHGPIDLSPASIQAAAHQLGPAFCNTPQFVDDGLSAELGCEVVVKIETLNPIGSFKGRGTSVLARKLDPALTWVCSTAGNFGQGLAYAARQQQASLRVFASGDVMEAKVARMRRLGASVDVCDDPEAAARKYAAERDDRVLVVDGLDPAMAEGAGTIAVELGSLAEIETAVVQVGDGALIAGIACWLKSVTPKTRIVGVCASGAPAMARSFAAGRAVAVQGTGTIAAALAVTEPVPESVARVTALVDEILLVEDDDLRGAMRLIADSLGVLVEPAGAAGIAALLRYGTSVGGNRVAVILTGSAGLAARHSANRHPPPGWCVGNTGQ
jgi:threonine dehydratase